MSGTLRRVTGITNLQRTDCLDRAQEIVIRDANNAVHLELGIGHCGACLSPTQARMLSALLTEAADRVEMKKTPVAPAEAEHALNE